MIQLILLLLLIVVVLAIESNKPVHKPTGVSKSDYKDWYYNTYLKSSHWRRRRRRALSLAGNRCENCNSTTKLQVHHLSYNNLGHENDYELQCLCRKCHKSTHNIA